MKITDNTISAVFHYFSLQVGSFYDENEVNSLVYLSIEYLFGYTKSTVLLNPKLRFTESELLRIIRLVKRLKKKEPIDYIIGHKEFYGLKINVDPTVLIPRPETEELVDWIVKKEGPELKRIVDVCTGSGCIALALKKSFPHADIHAIDVSEQALKMAQFNAVKNQLNLSFHQKDILHQSLDMGMVDIIVSNPPYVRESEKQYMRKNVLNYEPALALFVDDANPLLFYHRLHQIAKDALNKGGSLYLEINETFGKELLSVFSDFYSVELRKDLSNKDRFIRAVK